MAEEVIPSTTEIKPTKRLYRSEADRVIAGVAGGLGDYFGIDPTILRIIFVLMAVYGGYGVLFYIVLWIVMPTQSRLQPISQETMRQNMAEIKGQAETWANQVKAPAQHSDSRVWLGFFIVLFGLMFLFRNFGIFDVFDLGRIWPLFIVGLGIVLLLRK